MSEISRLRRQMARRKPAAQEERFAALNDDVSRSIASIHSTVIVPGFTREGRHGFGCF
jgi:hypothetical protein